MKSESKSATAIEASGTRRDQIRPIEPWSNHGSLPPNSAAKARRARMIGLCVGISGTIGAVDESSEGRMLSTLERLASIGPKDAAESMLAELMVVTHSAAIACASAAHDAGLGSPMASTHLVHLERLTAAYLAEMTMLDRHRGKPSQQQVIVKRVDVSDGGQAIVGQVNASNNPSNSQPKHQGMPPLSGNE